MNAPQFESCFVGPSSIHLPTLSVCTGVRTRGTGRGGGGGGAFSLYIQRYVLGDYMAKVYTLMLIVLARTCIIGQSCSGCNPLQCLFTLTTLVPSSGLNTVVVVSTAVSYCVAIYHSLQNAPKLTLRDMKNPARSPYIISWHDKLSLPITSVHRVLSPPTAKQFLTPLLV